ncbi:MAG: hypothetical protein K6A36_05965 [Paludibacteraceae bacterium]|nr:hypothetical protein [Paludibacteraceae bacterium]
MGNPIASCPQLIERIHQVGFLPLLDSGIPGFNAEVMMDEDCHYISHEDGSWEWPLWSWKSPAVREGDCVYGKFFSGKAGFVAREWWPDFCNYRRSIFPFPEVGSVENMILTILIEHGSAIARELRAACGLTGPKMRGRFDAFVCRLQMGCYVVTEDFVYPRDKRGREYGFGWQLLNTPESLLGRDACTCQRSPEESYGRIKEYLCSILPQASDKQIEGLISK